MFKKIRKAQNSVRRGSSDNADDTELSRYSLLRQGHLPENQPKRHTVNGQADNETRDEVH